MQQNSSLNLPKWPFYVGNILLVGIAIFLAFQAGSQLTTAQFFWSFLCVASGAVIFATPFILEYQGQIKIAQAKSKTIGTSQLKQIDNVLSQMQDVQEAFTQQTNKQTMSHTMLDAVLKNLDNRLTSFSESVGSFDALADNIATLGDITQKTQATGLAPVAQKLLEQMGSQIQSIQQQLQAQSASTQSQATSKELRSLSSQVENIGNVLSNLQQTLATQAATLNTLQSTTTSQATTSHQGEKPGPASPVANKASQASLPLNQRASLSTEDLLSAEKPKTYPTISDLLAETHDIVNEAEALFNSVTEPDSSSTQNALSSFTNPVTKAQEGEQQPSPQTSNTTSLWGATSTASPATQQGSNAFTQSAQNGPTNIDDLVEKNIYAPENIHISMHGDDSFYGSTGASNSRPSSLGFSQATQIAPAQATNTATATLENQAAQQTLFTQATAAPTTAAAFTAQGLQQPTARTERQNQTQQQVNAQTRALTSVGASAAPSYMETLLQEDSGSTGEAKLQEEDTPYLAQGLGTTLTVHALPGLGKKPFIRGQGPGLSWNHGTPMELIETGKWQWTSPDSSQPVILRVYKDDDIPAEGEAIALEPGEQLEITPTFKS